MQPLIHNKIHPTNDLNSSIYSILTIDPPPTCRERVGSTFRNAALALQGTLREGLSTTLGLSFDRFGVDYLSGATRARSALFNANQAAQVCPIEHPQAANALSIAGEAILFPFSTISSVSTVINGLRSFFNN